MEENRLCKNIGMQIPFKFQKNQCHYSKHLSQTNSIHAKCYENYSSEYFMSIENTTLPDNNYSKNKQNHKGKITQEQSKA